MTRTHRAEPRATQQRKREALAVCGALALALSAGCAGDAGSRAPEARIIVLGASASAGFLGLPLATALNAAFADEARVVVSDLSDARMFQAPRRFALSAVEQALALEPDAVIALDFPFWFGYGDTWSRRGELQELRLEKQAEGLALLERFHCPVILGDYPNVADSIPISPSQAPSTATLELLNQRLYEWAATRPNVLVLRLSDWVAQNAAGSLSKAVDGQARDAQSDALFQADGLHPTRAGTAVLAQAALEGLASSFSGTHPLQVGERQLSLMHRALATDPRLAKEKPLGAPLATASGESHP